MSEIRVITLFVAAALAFASGWIASGIRSSAELSDLRKRADAVHSDLVTVASDLNRAKALADSLTRANLELRDGIKRAEDRAGKAEDEARRIRKQIEGIIGSIGISDSLLGELGDIFQRVQKRGGGKDAKPNA